MLIDYKFQSAAFVCYITRSLQNASPVYSSTALPVHRSHHDANKQRLPRNVPSPSKPEMPSDVSRLTSLFNPPQNQASHRKRTDVFPSVILCYEHNKVEEAPPIVQMWWGKIRVVGKTQCGEADAIKNTFKANRGEVKPAMAAIKAECAATCRRNKQSTSAITIHQLRRLR
jgi:hypothetical protein